MIEWIKRVKAVARKAVEIALSRVETHEVCEVISYDSVTNTVSLQPVVKRMRTQDPNNLTTVQAQVIEDIPVAQGGSGGVLLTAAPQEGTYGYLHVSKRKLSSWLLKGGIVEPSSVRQFSSSDGVFYPCVLPLIPDGDNGALLVPVKTDRVEIRSRDGINYIAVTTAGNAELNGTKIKLGTAATEPAIKGTTFMNKDNAHTHSTAFGPSGVPIVPWTPADFSTKTFVE